MASEDRKLEWYEEEALNLLAKGFRILIEEKEHEKQLEKSKLDVGPLSIDWTARIEKITQFDRTFVRIEKV